MTITSGRKDAPTLDDKAKDRLRGMQESLGVAKKSAFLEFSKARKGKSRKLKTGDITVNVVDTRTDGGTRGSFGYAEIIVMDSGHDVDKIMLGDFDSSDKTIFMGDKDPTDGTWQVDKDLGGDQP